MDERFNKLEDKIDKIADKLDSVNITLVRNTESLEKHEYRTTLAEQNIDRIEKDLRPIKRHVTFINNILRFLAAVGAVILFLKKMDFI